MENVEKKYISPRAIAEAERQYTFTRFESYLSASDRGEMSRHLAIQAFKEEMEHRNEEPKTA